MLTRPAPTARNPLSVLSDVIELALLCAGARCWPAVARIMSPEPGLDDFAETETTRPFRDPLI